MRADFEGGGDIKLEWEVRVEEESSEEEEFLGPRRKMPIVVDLLTL